MALINTWFFTKTHILWDVIEKATHNKYDVVSVRQYTDKKHVLPDGYTLTLKVLEDDFNYGTDKEGNPREDNVCQNFDVTVFNRNRVIKKGDCIRLLGFDDEHSFAMGFDLVLRFKDCEIIQPQEVKANV